ncbi:glycerophosphodiester phosphodiesterase family protein [Paenibacillus sp. UMB4589-SE434]|uniref:glycerophosphodiester phosphodiesterase n=1 Tax=Paenibacillus sp. UMB4589-SE434 TaxID=3046314 RepID=UPI00254D92CA|nr:glycerophosphodiester phosphodiesterase family protein [Paenibacillus sp. UMB4589-SE434]MDK8181446.1 glycerophosphodiester phosphodiesterase family protein [Paenibacillus sp. UMB4589-SE434]
MAIRGIAHRGYPLKYPENTMVGFQAALEFQFSHVELDVQLTKDGIPVVIHDPTVNRTINGEGTVKSYTLAELRKLDAGLGERIPTLEEALLFLRDRVCIDLELKQTGNLYPGLEEAVLEVVRQTGTESQVILTSFDHYSVERIRKLDAHIQLGLIMFGASPAVFPYMKQLNACALSVRHLYLTSEYIERCAEEGVQLMAWTPDDEPSMLKLAAYPDILVCTNNLEGWANVHRQGRTATV